MKLRELGLLYDGERAILISLFLEIGQLYSVSRAGCVAICDTYFIGL